MGTIDISIQDQIVSVTINNPEKMNCIDMPMLKALDHHIEKIRRDKSVRAIKLSGIGNKAFSTGADLNEFGKLDETGVVEWIKYGNKVFNTLESLPIPSVAIIHGYALGGGFELTLACDLRIADENAIFSFPELKHGWIPGWGGLSRLRKLIGESRAKQIIMLGENIDSKKALEMGIVNKIYDEDSFEEEVAKLINHFKKIDPFLMEMTKSALMTNRNAPENDILFDVLATQYSKSKS